MPNSKKVVQNELEFIRIGSSIRKSQLTVIIAWFSAYIIAPVK
jgi:hypothetical protein